MHTQQNLFSESMSDQPTKKIEKPKDGMMWIVWVFAAVLIAVLAIYCFKGSKSASLKGGSFNPVGSYLGGGGHLGLAETYRRSHMQSL